MSNKIKGVKSKPKKQIKLAYLGASIIMMLVVTIGLVSFFVGKNEGSKNKSSIPVIDVSKNKSQQVLGTKIYSLTGEIQSVENSKIVFSTQIKNDNGEVTTKKLSALIFPNTEILKWDLSKSVNTQITNSQQPISIDDLQPGQQIVIKSTREINGQNEIEAASINLLITP